MSNAQTTPLTHDAYCPACGYNVRGVAECRCPECGEAFDPAKVSASQIPWSHRRQVERRQVGRVRAFLRTVWFVTFRAERLAASAVAELDRAEVRRFRLVCEILMAIPICAVLVMVGWQISLPSPSALPTGAQTSLVKLWAGQFVMLSIMAAGWWPFMLLLGLSLAHWLAVFPARLASFMRYAEAQRENLITAAYYLAGSVLGGGLIGVIAGVIVVVLGTVTFFGAGLPPWSVLAEAMAATATLVAGSIWLAAGFHYFRQVAIHTQTSMGRVLGVGLMLTGLWVGVWAVLMPLCIGLMNLIYWTW